MRSLTGAPAKFVFRGRAGARAILKTFQPTRFLRKTPKGIPCKTPLEELCGEGPRFHVESGYRLHSPGGKRATRPKPIPETICKKHKNGKTQRNDKKAGDPVVKMSDEASESAIFDETLWMPFWEAALTSPEGSRSPCRAGQVATQRYSSTSSTDWRCPKNVMISLLRAACVRKSYIIDAIPAETMQQDLVSVKLNMSAALVAALGACRRAVARALGRAVGCESYHCNETRQSGFCP